jgi:hypothetical protein
MNATTSICSDCKPDYRAPVSERLQVMWRNRGCWKIKLALFILHRAFKKDPGFRQSWHANIAMPIYDATRCDPTKPSNKEIAAQAWCYPGTQHHVMDVDLCSAFAVVLELREIEARPDIDRCNLIADNLMKHLFNA